MILASMADYFPPDVKKEAFNCPHCGVYAHQEFNPIVAYGYTSNNAYSGKHIITRGYLENFVISKCTHCKQIIIWNQESMLFPRKMIVQDPSDNVPEKIKDIYIEAGKVLMDSPRASGALIRLALELLLQHVNKNNLGLNENVKELIKSNIPEDLIKAMTILRVNGNDIMHTGEIKILEKEEEVAYLFDLFNMIVEEMITRPKKLNESYKRIPESIRKEIENKK